MKTMVSLMLLLSIFATSTVLSRDGSFNEQFCSVTLSSCYLSVIKSNSQDSSNVDKIKKAYNSCEDEYAQCTKRAADILCTKKFPRQCKRAQDLGDSCGSDAQIELCKTLYEDLYSVPDKCTVSFNTCLFRDNHIKDDAESVLHRCILKKSRCHNKQIQKTCSPYGSCDADDSECQIMNFLCDKAIPS